MNGTGMHIETGAEECRCSTTATQQGAQTAERLPLRLASGGTSS